MQKLTEFEGLFHAHHASVFHFLRRLLPNAEDVEDCLQETFLRFWRSWSEYNERGLVRAYLFKIARNLVIDHLRHHRPERDRRTSMAEVSSVLEARPDSEGSCEQKELLQMVREKVQQLPFSQRTTFLLFRYHGMSYQEIAEIQGISVKTVDSRLYRAMKWLGRHLNGHPARKSEGQM